MTFELKELSERQQADFQADGRMRAYLSLKKAFKKRASENGVTVQALAKAIGRDKGQVSRILSGTSKGITLDTLVLIISALGCRISFDAKPMEEMAKKNRNVAPTIHTFFYPSGVTPTANTMSTSPSAATTRAITVAPPTQVTIAAS